MSKAKNKITSVRISEDDNLILMASGLSPQKILDMFMILSELIGVDHAYKYVDKKVLIERLNKSSRSA